MPFQGKENAQILAGFMQEIFVGEFEIRGSAVNISRNGLQQGKPVAEMLAYILRLCREDIELCDISVVVMRLALSGEPDHDHIVKQENWPSKNKIRRWRGIRGVFSSAAVDVRASWSTGGDDRAPKFSAAPDCDGKTRSVVFCGPTNIIAGAINAMFSKETTEMVLKFRSLPDDFDVSSVHVAETKVRVEKDQGLVRLSGLPLPLDALAGKMMVFLPQKLHAQFQVVDMKTLAALRHFDTPEGHEIIARRSGIRGQDFRLVASWAERRMLVELVETNGHPKILTHVGNVLDREVKEYCLRGVGVQLDDYFIEAMLSAFIHQEFDDGSLDIKDRFVSLLSEAVGVSLQLERGFLAGVLPDANYLEPESAQRKLEDMVVHMRRYVQAYRVPRR